MTPFDELAGEQFLALTTYRRSGTPVSTAVWAAPDGTGLLVWTGAESGKVKRLLANPSASVAPCDRRGTVTGPAKSATAKVLPAAELRRVRAALTRKYQWRFRAVELLSRAGRLIRLNAGQVGLEITLR